MKLLKTILGKLAGISKAGARFPLAFLGLIAIASINAVSIENNHDFGKQIISLVVAVFCFIVAQVLSERFGKTIISKIIFYLAATAISIGYYFVILTENDISLSISVKTTVAIFALLVSFIWIPSIKGKSDFNAVFMSIFKAIFTSAFFSAIIWGGISLIIVAVDQLLINVNQHAYLHTANIVWVVFASMLFLSLIPTFNGKETDEERIKKASSCPRFLEVLLSYVLVPLEAIYSLVLLLYIVKTVFTSNWNNNLLEPLSLSYCISVILLYVLVSDIKNRFATIFRKVFPKLLVLIALFQIVSSVTTVFSDGIVHTSYFVLMFGLYCVICGILLSIFPPKKNGIIAAIAIAFALVCITPRMDAFSVSFASQSSIIENTLEKNDMLKNSTVTPNANVSEEDKTKIVSAFSYINRINDTDRLDFLPDDFESYKDFEQTFGFPTKSYYAPIDTVNKHYTNDSLQLIDIGNYVNMSQQIEQLSRCN